MSVGVGVEGRAVGLVDFGALLGLDGAEILLVVHLEEKADLAADVALAKAVGDEGCHASPVEAAAAASEAFGLTPVELREGELAVIFR